MTSGPRGRKGKRVLRLDRGVREVHSALDEEIALHLALRIEQLIERGMSPDDARAEALRRFGGGGSIEGFRDTTRVPAQIG